MTLEWVYGYRCYDTRGSVLYTKPTRDVVFFTGCTVVVRQAGRRSKQGGRVAEEVEWGGGEGHSCYRPPW